MAAKTGLCQAASMSMIGAGHWCRSSPEKFWTTTRNPLDYVNRATDARTEPQGRKKPFKSLHTTGHKKMRKLVFLSMLPILLSACISAPIDKRSIAQQREDFNRATAALVGEYLVLDSRKDDYSVTSFTVKLRDNNLIVIAYQKGGNNFLVTGKDCSGWDRGIEKTIFCGEGSDVFTYVNFTLTKYPRTIDDGLTIFKKPSMEVKPGDYLLELGRKGGRTHSYLVKKIEGETVAR